MTGSLFCDDGLLNYTTILKSLGLEKPKPSPAAVIEPIMSVAVGVAPDTTHFTLVHMILAFYIVSTSHAQIFRTDSSRSM